MTSTHEIIFTTTNKDILDVLYEDKISIVTLDNNTVFEYKNGGRKNKILIVNFRYNNKIVNKNIINKRFLKIIKVLIYL